MKQPTARSALRSELTLNLIPKLRAAGFSGPAEISGNALLHDFKRSAGQAMHVLCVQLEKYGLPRFILDLTVEPPEGFEAVVARGRSVRQGRLQPRHGASTSAWFRADPTVWQWVGFGTPHSAVAAVAACVSLLPEVEAWWQTESESKHISVVEHKFPGSQNADA